MQDMFFPTSSSNYNVNPFYHPPGQALLTLEHNGIIFDHHHGLVPANPQQQQQLSLNETLLNMALLNKDSGGDRRGFGFPVKKATKKDRHSKICTAQGVRDRRVRLSIEISREFFDLQDLLGFDKASKTVEWLLRKSKNAIREVVKMKQYGNGFAYEDPYETAAENEGKTPAGAPLLAKESRAKTPAGAPLLAKESRAKARARARERTREKMCIGSAGSANSLTHLDQTSKKSDHLGYGYNNQSMASSSYKVVEQPSTAREHVNEESIVITSVVKPSTILGYHQNYLASCSSNASNDFPNLSQNMDIIGANAMSHSTLCAITNVNLSTAGVQLYGKP